MQCFDWNKFFEEIQMLLFFKKQPVDIHTLGYCMGEDSSLHTEVLLFSKGLGPSVHLIE